METAVTVTSDDTAGAADTVDVVSVDPGSGDVVAGAIAGAAAATAEAAADDAAAAQATADVALAVAESASERQYDAVSWTEHEALMARVAALESGSSAGSDSEGTASAEFPLSPESKAPEKADRPKESKPSEPKQSAKSWWFGSR